jgi:fatty acid synthase subunit beta
MSGIKLVAFKPGSVNGILQVAASNSDFLVILQWTGGRAGGHHSLKDFHQPILATYCSIRSQRNIRLVAGSGFGAAEDVWSYLSGEWSVDDGMQPMPFDGFLFTTRVLVIRHNRGSFS